MNNNNIYVTKCLVTNVHERSAKMAVKSLLKAGFSVQQSVAAKSLHLLPNKKDVSLHPCPSNETIAFKNWMEEQLKADNTLLVLPINEAVLFLCDQLRQNHPEFSGRFIMPSVSSLKYALSKYVATKAAINADIKVPKTHFIKVAGSNVIHLPKDKLSFPMILKWDNVFHKGVYHKGGLRKVQNQLELEDTVMELRPLDGNIILQELVPGHGVGAFFLRQNGKMILRFAHKRLHEVPWTGGVSAYCESSSDQDVLEAGERLLQAIDYEGLAMVEFRKVEGEAPVFLEINGRLWGSSGLALAAGADFPKAMLDYHLTGTTTVKQPDLNKIIRWHEPRFEMLYLQSIKSDILKAANQNVHLSAARKQVMRNFLNPLVHSDWWSADNLWSSMRNYLRLIKSELGNIKRDLSPKKVQETSDLVNTIALNTKFILQKNFKIKTILFVCYGNICRSPYAEFRWRKMCKDHVKLPIAKSVGFHDKVNRAMPLRFQSVAKHLGIDLTQHRSKRISKQFVNEADLLIAMDQRNLRDIQQEFPEALSKTILLGATSEQGTAEIEDPYGKQMGTGGAIYRRIDKELEHLKNQILGQ